MGRLNDIALATQVAVFGNKRAFDQLVREYQSPVRRFFLGQTLGDEMLSDDLAQDTFVKAYTHIAQYRGTSGFLTWLTRIAYNVWYDHCRKRLKVEGGGLKVEGGGWKMEGEYSAADISPSTLHLPPSTQTPSTQSPSTLNMDLYSALAILKDEERTCITLQLVDGYAIDEIADMMKMPSGTVKSHLRRGKEKLANYLRENGYDR